MAIASGRVMLFFVYCEANVGIPLRVSAQAARAIADVSGEPVKPTRSAPSFEVSQVAASRPRAVCPVSALGLFFGPLAGWLKRVTLECG
ncbi:hypothetical protein QW131_32055 [Roseibium salinum]|nr:hypothetical protein [Roseibium salinum]